MKSAYLDNNIIIDIENGYFLLEDIKYVDSEISEFFYSAAHLQEAHEISGSDKQERLKKRFETISQVTKNRYLFHEIETKIVHKQFENPATVYNTIIDVDFAQTALKLMVNLVNEGQKAIFRQKLNLDLARLNNYSPEDVVKQINQKEEFGGMSIVELFDYGFSLFPDANNFGLHNKFAGLFEILDLVGYWKDKHSERSNYARLWDSNHAYYSSFCNYFFSNDRRTRNKAKVAFHIFGIDTKVLSAKGEP